MTHAIDALPETLFPLPTRVALRSVFIPAGYDHIWRPEPFDVVLAPGEQIASVETVPPNPAIGAGTRVWIAAPPVEVSQ